MYTTCEVTLLIKAFDPNDKNLQYYNSQKHHGPGLSNHRGWKTLEVEVEGNIDRTLAQSLCIKLPH